MNEINLHCYLFKFAFKLINSDFKKVYIQSLILFSNCLCETELETGKKIERNGKSCYLNGFIRGHFLDRKAKTSGIALNFLKVL